MGWGGSPIRLGGRLHDPWSGPYIFILCQALQFMQLIQEMGNVHTGEMQEGNGSQAGKMELAWQKDMPHPAVFMKTYKYFLSFRQERP